MKKALLTWALLLLSSMASAQGYVGIATGPTQQKVDCSGTLSCDTRDTGRKLYGGYKFSPIGAVELSYFDFGQVNAKIGDEFVDYTASSFSIGGAVFLPLAPRLTAVARLGISSSKAEVSGSWDNFSGSTSETHTNPYVGLGLDFAITPTLSLTGSFDRARIKFNNTSASTTLLAIGVSQAF
jgi:OOP family OmpA-OmpF porin